MLIDFCLLSIDELVKKDENGLLFTNGSELAKQFCVRNFIIERDLN